ncbi:MAG: hypothetical protein K8E66_04290, partial [Phycisphaerales bacterium]|nr:hypothetical protein [Phycisphaerales bacterium]
WLSPEIDARTSPPRTPRLAGLITRKPTGENAGSAWRVYLNFDANDSVHHETRIWIGPSARTKAVVTIGLDGGLDLQRFDGAGSTLGEPRAEVSRRSDRPARVEVTLPAGSVEPDGTLHLGLEFVDQAGNRWSWPRPMLPWQIEPARRVLDTKAWMGGLAP